MINNLKDKSKLFAVIVTILVLGVISLMTSISLIVVGVFMLKKSILFGVILIVASSLLTLVFLTGILCTIMAYLSGRDTTKGEKSNVEKTEKETVDEMKCDKCGATTNNGDKFCAQCGKKF